MWVAWNGILLRACQVRSLVVLSRMYFLVVGADSDGDGLGGEGLGGVLLEGGKPGVPPGSENGGRKGVEATASSVLQSWG